MCNCAFTIILSRKKKEKERETARATRPVSCCAAYTHCPRSVTTSTQQVGTHAVSGAGLQPTLRSAPYTGPDLKPVRRDLQDQNKNLTVFSVKYEVLKRLFILIYSYYVNNLRNEGL